MVWAVVFLLYLIGMIMTNVKSGTAGLINTLLGLVAWVIFSLVYWGILIFLDIQFNFLHWF